MYRVMIVDDMEIFRMELKRLDVWGASSGFEVESEASDGVEALKKLETHPVDLVITDIRMPHMDGVELLKSLMEQNKDMCVVLLSEFSEFGYARQGLVYGAFDYLLKPPGREGLKTMLQRAAVYIAEQVKKREQLDVLLFEKMTKYYPVEDVKKLIRLFREGDPQVIQAAESLFELVADEVQGQPLKMAHILEHAMPGLMEKLQQHYVWISLLYPVHEVTQFNFSSIASMSEMKAAFLDLIQDLIQILNKYEYGNAQPPIIRQICKVVLEHLDAACSIKLVAETLFMNQSYVGTLFREKTGESLGSYMTRVKMERAKILLTDGYRKTYEIADILGYKDVEYFSRVFKKVTGVSPTDYRNMLMGNTKS